MIAWPSLSFGPINLWSMPKMELDLNDEVLFERVIAENEAKFFQIRLVVSVFRGVQYISLRKYFLTYEGEWHPSKEGVSMEYSIDSSTRLTSGLIELLSMEESQDLVHQFFKDQKLSVDPTSEE
jgi:hypothetical protein